MGNSLAQSNGIIVQQDIQGGIIGMSALFNNALKDCF